MPSCVTRLPLRLAPVFLIVLAAPASAQLIPIRTVRLAQADQFDIFPSERLAMGGASIALADSLLDPFNNPAKGARVSASRVFGSPGLYHVTKDAGGGRTLPLGALLRSGPWFGAIALAGQVVDASAPRSQPIFVDRPIACVNCGVVPLPLPPADQSHENAIAFASVGRKLAGTGISVGASLSWARLTGMDGVEGLFAGSARVKQLGHATDLRLGVLKEWTGDRSLEAMVLHDRYAMTDDVTYLDVFWDPGLQGAAQRIRMEKSLDQTNTWGLHLAYQRPLGGTGWRIGWLATGNLQAHPHLPDYEISSVPRDPGRSRAFDAGVGVSRREGTATFGMDAVFEPIWTTTWAVADRPVETTLGDTIPAGARTIENRFRFSNAAIRIGAGDELELGTAGQAAGLQLGLMVRSVHYGLTQSDHVQVATRRRTEHWIEWTPTWGVNLRFPGLEIRYRGQVTNGTGRPGVTDLCTDGCVATPGTLETGGILVAPTGPITLGSVRVLSHQVSFVLPLR